MAFYEVIGAAFVVAFSGLLVYLVVRLIREHRDSERAWATLGGTPLVRFRYGKDQWRRFVRLEATRHAKFALACAVMCAVGLSALFFVMAYFLEPSVVAFARKEGGWLTKATVALSAGIGAFIFVQRAAAQHLLRWLVTRANRGDVCVFSTGVVIAGAALPWSTPSDSLLSATITPDRDLLVLKLEKREPQESGGDLWVPRTLRLPIPPGLDVTSVLSGVDISPSHEQSESAG